MLLASYLRLIIPVVTVASYSPTTRTLAFHEARGQSTLTANEKFKRVNIGNGIKAWEEVVIRGTQPTSISCDHLRESESENGNKWVGNLEEGQHRCPEWASTPPIPDENGNGGIFSVFHHLGLPGLGKGNTSCSYWDPNNSSMVCHDPKLTDWDEVIQINLILFYFVFLHRIVICFRSRSIPFTILNFSSFCC